MILLMLLIRLIVVLLLKKLNFSAITGKDNEWIKSCLRNRYQRVEM